MPQWRGTGVAIISSTPAAARQHHISSGSAPCGDQALPIWKTTPMAARERHRLVAICSRPVHRRLPGQNDPDDGTNGLGRRPHRRQWRVGLLSRRQRWRQRCRRRTRGAGRVAGQVIAGSATFGANQAPTERTARRRADGVRGGGGGGGGGGNGAVLTGAGSVSVRRRFKPAGAAAAGGSTVGGGGGRGVGANGGNNATAGQPASPPAGRWGGQPAARWRRRQAVRRRRRRWRWRVLVSAWCERRRRQCWRREWRR